MVNETGEDYGRPNTEGKSNQSDSEPLLIQVHYGLRNSISKTILYVVLNLRIQTKN